MGAATHTAHHTSHASRTDRNLTQRELEVLRLVAVGNTDMEIADQLFISRFTVSNHVSNILSKLGVANRTSASLWLIKRDGASTREGGVSRLINS